MAAHSRMLAWKIPWTEKPGRLQSIGLQSKHSLVTKLSNYSPSAHFTPEWNLTPVSRATVSSSEASCLINP